MQSVVKKCVRGNFFSLTFFLLKSKISSPIWKNYYRFYVLIQTVTVESCSCSRVGSINHEVRMQNKTVNASHVRKYLIGGSLNLTLWSLENMKYLVKKNSIRTSFKKSAMHTKLMQPALKIVNIQLIFITKNNAYCCKSFIYQHNFVIKKKKKIIDKQRLKHITKIWIAHRRYTFRVTPIHAKSNNK